MPLNSDAPTLLTPVGAAAQSNLLPPVAGLTIGIPRETATGEKRVAVVPEVVGKLIKLGFKVAVESGAGDGANFSDDSYRAAGAEIIVGAVTLWSGSDIIFKVRGPSAEEVGLISEGSTLVSFIWPAQNPELLQQLAARKATVLAMDSVPRISPGTARLSRRLITSAVFSPDRSRRRARFLRPRSL